MTVTLEQIQSGVLKYIEGEIAPKATGFTKFLIYFAIPSLPNKIQAILSNAMESGMFTDLFDESGKIKLDEAYARTKDALLKSGKIYVSQINYFIDEQDLMRVYDIIKKA